MPVVQYVNGPARIRVGPQASTSLDYLGLSDRGVRLTFHSNTRDVETDATGDTPADVQEFPEIAFISFRLVAWDEVVRQYLFSRVINGVPWLEGETAPPGVLLGASGAMKTVRIESPYGNQPYVFNYCHLHQSRELNLGTERSAWQITLRAIAGIGTNSDPGGYESNANLTKLFYRPNS